MREDQPFQALYRKYRPQKFADVAGQKHITDTLEAAIKHGKISHAYLFTGPRGVGKTSVARILAHEINGFKYGDRTAKLDVIEIDGASNRRIEEVRELRDKANILPSQGKYKVYIIDEVHMLTKEAFNALLKTLEEPPAHCVFILATTEAHKLPETIVSRTQRFSFKPISEAELKKHLAKLAKLEKISIDEDSLQLLAAYGDGSFRDSISLLDQIYMPGVGVTGESVRSSLGMPPEELIEELLAGLAGGDRSKLTTALDSLNERNTSPSLIAKTLAEKLRQQLRQGSSLANLPQLLKDLLEVPASHSPQDRLEIALLEFINDFNVTPPPNIAAAPPNVETKPERPIQTAKPPARSKSSSGSHALPNWQQVIAKIKEQDPTLSLALKHSFIQKNDKHLDIIFGYPIYMKKCDNLKNKKLISQILSEHFNFDEAIRLVVDKNLYLELKSLDESKTRKSVDAISNIFGGGEVVESTVNI